MASSSWGSREDDDVDLKLVPGTLRERLGPEGTSGLLHVLALSQREWSDDVISGAVDRFERRLTEGTSSLRVQMAQSEVALRQEIGQVRHEVGQVDARLRQDLSQMEVRLLKWSFLFWIGQVVALSAVMAAMLRIVR
jgi:hypothetical protein